MDEKFDADVLSNLSDDERRHLLRLLVGSEQRAETKVGTSWRWDLLLVLIIVGCIVLAAWIGYLVVSLPAFYRAGSWRGAWVGFDVAELAAFAATGWAAWKRRQILIICLIVLATLLLCDAWFDVVLDARTAGFISSLVSALLVEVPVAVIAILVARRLLRLAIGQVIRYEGGRGPVPSLWKVPLFTTDDGTAIERLIKAAKSDGQAENREVPSAIWPEAGREEADPPLER
ncbi:MAG TPA: hypothetical protein VMA95_03660 [Streptosporangiaceae bacterium]|nr:hypothetical protein [Streptosporangiaceae bacterium]